MAGKGNSNCIIGKGSSFTGKFTVNGSLYVDGKFEGDINTDGNVVIGAEGKMKTNLSAARVNVGGAFIGNIRASEEVAIEPTGKVLGDITAPKIDLQDGAVLEGATRIRGYGDGAESIRKQLEEDFGTGPVVSDQSGGRKKSVKKKGR